MDLLELLDEMDNPGPTMARPDCRDTSTGERVTRNDRCPDCNQLAWGSCYPPEGQRRVYRVAAGWRTLGSCRCGRYRYHALSERASLGDTWTRGYHPLGPIVDEPDVDAWMEGGPRG